MEALRQLHRRLGLLPKILIANTVLIVLASAAGSRLAGEAAGGGRADKLVFLVVVGVVAAALVNYAILRFALRPLYMLRGVMRRVLEGDFRARAPRVDEDPDMARLADAFNRTLEELERYRQETARRVIAAQEEERRRIARELHDQAGQAISAVLIHLGVLESSVTDPALRERTARVRALAQEILGEIRRLIGVLRPAVLDDLGLVPALRAYLRDVVSAAGVKAEVRTEGEIGRLAPAVETALYRIVQEALTNALRHARARTVTVEVRRRGDQVEVAVTDDGEGFAVEEVAARARQRGHLGLLSMSDRAALLGGEVHIASQPGAGTRVTVRLPAVPREQGDPVAAHGQPAPRA